MKGYVVQFESGGTWLDSSMTDKPVDYLVAASALACRLLSHVTAPDIRAYRIVERESAEAAA